jgi:hypothetical protein
MRLITLLLFSVLPTAVCFAQDETPFIKKSFVIIKSVKNYNEAKTAAVSAAKKLNQNLDLRDLKPNKKSGLTYADSVCENEGGYPCYISRGRYDDGDYISIEWSNAFQGFAKGYYIVMAGSSANKTEAASLLAKAKKIFKDAYIKSAEVYVGCMH